MAYMPQELKKQLVKKVRAVLPKDWKVTFGVENGTGIVMNINSAGTDIQSKYIESTQTHMMQSTLEQRLEHAKTFGCSVHSYIGKTEFCQDKELNDILVKVNDALNSENYDNSDVQTDYFDKRYHVWINIGRFDKPFIVK
jgi:hypothetical protein